MATLNQKLQARLQKDKRAVIKAILQTANEFIPIIRTNTPIDTGLLRNSLQVRQDRNTVIIYSNLRYALAVHETNKNYRKGGWKFITNTIKSNRRFLNKKILSLSKSFL